MEQLGAAHATSRFALGGEAEAGEAKGEEGKKQGADDGKGAARLGEAEVGEARGSGCDAEEGLEQHVAGAKEEVAQHLTDIKPPHVTKNHKFKIFQNVSKIPITKLF